MKNLLIAAATISFLGNGVIADEFKPDNCSIENGLDFNQVRFMLEEYKSLLDNVVTLNKRNSELDLEFKDLLAETDKIKVIADAANKGDKKEVENVNELITAHNLKYVTFQDKRTAMLDDVATHNFNQQEFAKKYLKVEFCEEHLDFYRANGFADTIDKLEASIVKIKN